MGWKGRRYLVCANWKFKPNNGCGAFVWCAEEDKDKKASKDVVDLSGDMVKGQEARKLPWVEEKKFPGKGHRLGGGKKRPKRAEVAAAKAKAIRAPPERRRNCLSGRLNLFPLLLM